jgi:ATP-dependent Clp endopeptidase proteolytic subunit ClpP
MSIKTMEAAVRTFRATNPKHRFAAKVINKPKPAPAAPRAAKEDDKEECCGEMYLYDAIGLDWYGGISAKDVVAAIKAIEAAGATKMNIYINSPGGDVFEGVAMYNALSRFKGTKHVFIDGLAASAASFIAMSGDTITTAFNAMWMIHNPWGVVIGNANDMREIAKTLDTIGGTLVETYAKRTKQGVDDLKAWMDAETWMTAAEAKERGFTDSVTEEDDEEEDDDEGTGVQKGKGAKGSDDDEDTDAAASLLHKFKNTPANLKPRASALVRAMEKRTKDIPKRASPPRT